MITFKKRVASIILVSLFSAATMVSCGKQANTEAATEAAADSTEHPADSTEHPKDSTEHPAGEHPEDTTKH